MKVKFNQITLAKTDKGYTSGACDGKYNRIELKWDEQNRFGFFFKAKYSLRYKQFFVELGSCYDIVSVNSAILFKILFNTIK